MEKLFEVSLKAHGIVCHDGPYCRMPHLSIHSAGSRLCQGWVTIGTDCVVKHPQSNSVCYDPTELIQTNDTPMHACIYSHVCTHTQTHTQTHTHTLWLQPHLTDANSFMATKPPSLWLPSPAACIVYSLSLARMNTLQPSLLNTTHALYITAWSYTVCICVCVLMSVYETF